MQQAAIVLDNVLQSRKSFLNLTDEPVSQTCTIVMTENLPTKCPSTLHSPSLFPDISTTTMQIANDLDNGDEWASDRDMRDSDWEGNIVPSDSECDTTMRVDMDSIPDSPQPDINEEITENPREQSSSAGLSLLNHLSVLGSHRNLKVYNIFTHIKCAADDLERGVEMKDKPRTFPEKRLIGEVDGAMSSQLSLGESVVNEMTEEGTWEKHTQFVAIKEKAAEQEMHNEASIKVCSDGSGYEGGIRAAAVLFRGFHPPKTLLYYCLGLGLLVRACD